MRSAKDCQIHRYRLDDGQPSLQPRHQYWSEYWLDDERLPFVYHQLSKQSSSPRSGNEDDWQDALNSAPNEATRKRQQKRGNKKEATRKKQQERIRVNVVLELEAGRRPEICLPDTGSVGEPAVAV